MEGDRHRHDEKTIVPWKRHVLLQLLLLERIKTSAVSSGRLSFRELDTVGEGSVAPRWMPSTRLVFVCPHQLVIKQGPLSAQIMFSLKPNYSQSSQLSYSWLTIMGKQSSCCTSVLDGQLRASLAHTEWPSRFGRTQTQMSMVSRLTLSTMLNMSIHPRSWWQTATMISSCQMPFLPEPRYARPICFTVS